ncbi:MAG TPA: secretin N-terminal domain-containing protein [Verrucomicrobiae bacterium]
MKPLDELLFAAALIAGLTIAAPPQPAAGAVPEARTGASPGATGNGADCGLRLNFRGAPLETVLNYLSEAAGFAIVLEAQPRGSIDAWSDQPLSKDEALDLVNSALLKNGYAAIRRGRILTIVNRDDARTRALPVKLGADPESIPQTDELVTQIVPVKFTEAAQLINVLQPLASIRTTMTANESANTIVITDTQANIHRLAEVIQAVDSGAEDFTIVKVFHLRNANSTEMADVLAQLFPEETNSQSTSSPVPFGGVPGAFPGGPGGLGGAFGPPGANTSAGGLGNQARRIKNRAKVTAVADQRTQALVVTASRDLMPQVELIVRQLDGDPTGRQDLAVYQLKNASASALAKVLQDTFQKNGTANNRTSSTQTDALENRATTQNQQNNTSSRTGSGRSSGGTGQSGFGGSSSGGATGL